MKKTIEIIKFELLIIFLVSQVFGALWGVVETANHKETGCQYTSIAKYTNIGYIVSCELFRVRWGLK